MDATRKQIRDLEIERDYWHDAAECRGRESDEWRRRYERSSIMTGAATVGAKGYVGELEAEIARLQYERDEFPALLRRSSDFAAVEYQKSVDGDEKLAAKLFEETPASVILLQVLRIPRHILESLSADQKNVFSNELAVADSATLQVAGESVTDLMQVSRRTGENLAFADISQAILFSHNPEIVRWLIKNELQFHGAEKLHIELVRRLSLDWIKGNISQRIGSHKQLYTALVQAGKCLSSNVSRREYARLEGVSFDTLKVNVGYYQKLVNDERV